MRILGIETSCDETAIAVIEASRQKGADRIRVLSNVVLSQAKLHSKFGGVVPHLAKREHQKALVPVLVTALKEARIMDHEPRVRRKTASRDSKFGILDSILEREPELLERMKKYMLPQKPPPIDAIAVTIGPGLAPALWVGVNFARALAFIWEKPVIPVNHLEGHIAVNLLAQTGEYSRSRMPKRAALKKIKYPALCLIVSGGHTELVLVKRFGAYRIVGETLDDAAGEAFDKTAKMLHLGYPGGPIISRIAERGRPDAVSLPRPMLRSDNFDFSFSGLKTAVLYALRDHGNVSKEDVAASFEQAVADVLVSKTLRAAKEFRAETVMIAGGVAANRRLRGELRKALLRALPDIEFLAPDPSLTGDNALMIALAGYLNRKKKTAWRSLQADAGMRLAN